MSRWSEREIARKLAEHDELEPPAGLLEKIKSEIPPMIPVGTGVPEIDRRPSMPPRQRWLIAASMVTMIGAGLLALHRTEVPPVEETVRTAAGARQPAPRGVILPSTPAAPPQPRALTQPLEKAPEPKPVPQREEKQLKSLGYISSPEGSVEPGAPAGVVGGVAGGAPAGPPPAPSLAPPPPPPAAVQELADKKESAAGTLSRDEEKRQSNENLPRSAAPALQEAAKPQAALRAKAAEAEPAWKVPSAWPIDVRGDVGTASYVALRRSLAEGRLPDPAAIRIGEILNAFETGGAPPVEGAPTPFVHGPGYWLLRIHPSGAGPALLSFNPVIVARYRLVGSGTSALYEIELRSDAPRDSQVATLHLGETGRAVLLSDLAPSWDKASPGFRLAALAARFAEVIKGTPGDLSEIARQATAVGKDLPNRIKAEDLADMAARIQRIRG
ncbi:MAG TPA: von Willebrand factor type A domain-containing protein [Thermoanaerobaculia bacterium]